MDTRKIGRKEAQETQKGGFTAESAEDAANGGKRRVGIEMRGAGVISSGVCL